MEYAKEANGFLKRREISIGSALAFSLQLIVLKIEATEGPLCRKFRKTVNFKHNLFLLLLKFSFSTFGGSLSTSILVILLSDKSSSVIN